MTEDGKTTRYLIQRKVEAAVAVEGDMTLVENVEAWVDVTWVTVPSRAKRNHVLQAASDSLDPGVPVTLRALDEASALEHSGTPAMRFV